MRFSQIYKIKILITFLLIIVFSCKTMEESAKHDAGKAHDLYKAKTDVAFDSLCKLAWIELDSARYFDSSSIILDSAYYLSLSDTIDYGFTGESRKILHCQLDSLFAVAQRINRDRIDRKEWYDNLENALSQQALDTVARKKELEMVGQKKKWKFKLSKGKIKKIADSTAAEMALYLHAVFKNIKILVWHSKADNKSTTDIAVGVYTILSNVDISKEAYKFFAYGYFDTGIDKLSKKQDSALTQTLKEHFKKLFPLVDRELVKYHIDNKKYVPVFSIVSEGYADPQEYDDSTIEKNCALSSRRALTVDILSTKMYWQEIKLYHKDQKIYSPSHGPFGRCIEFPNYPIWHEPKYYFVNDAKPDPNRRVVILSTTFSLVPLNE